MRAAGLDYEHRELTLKERPEPDTVGGDCALLRVQEVGICGTDRELASFRFGYPPKGETFLTMGHEALARVVETGPDAHLVHAGDWVVPFVRRRCEPPCISCARGRRDLCVSGGYTERGIFGRHGYLTDYAIDSEANLVRIPPGLAEIAVLIEPLSVVEKAVETALRIHEPGARTALVLGAGPVGILAALVLQQRGLEAAVYSLEEPSHPRVRLLACAGVRYLTRLDGVSADVVIEAAGSPQAAFAGLRALAPLGVCGILGSPNASGEVPFLDLLRHNQAVFGSVNASPAAFTQAVEDLARLDRGVRCGMIRRARFEDVRETIPAPAGGDAAKIVHVLGD